MSTEETILNVLNNTFHTKGVKNPSEGYAFSIQMPPYGQYQTSIHWKPSNTDLTLSTLFLVPLFKGPSYPENDPVYQALCEFYDRKNQNYKDRAVWGNKPVFSIKVSDGLDPAYIERFAVSFLQEVKNSINNKIAEVERVRQLISKKN